MALLHPGRTVTNFASGVTAGYAAMLGSAENGASYAWAAKANMRLEAQSDVEGSRAPV